LAQAWRATSVVCISGAMKTQSPMDDQSLPGVVPACLLCRDSIKEDPGHRTLAEHKARVQSFLDDPQAHAQIICEASALRYIIREELRLGLSDLQKVPVVNSKNSKCVAPASSGVIAKGPRSLPPDLDLGLRKAADCLSDIEVESPCSQRVAANDLLPFCLTDEGESAERGSGMALKKATAPNKDSLFVGSLSAFTQSSLETESSGDTDNACALTTKTKSENTSLGKKPKKKLPQRSLLRSGTDVDDEDHSTKLQRFTSSAQFERFSGLLILVNAVFIGWQTQYLSQYFHDRALRGEQLGEGPIVFLAMSSTFSVLFLVELAPRWIGAGLIDFFKTLEWQWNVFDVVVVTVSIIESMLEIIDRSTSIHSAGVLQNVSAIRVLRIVRVVRVVRVIRVMKFVRERRMMIYSILGSMKNLMWVMIILVVTFYLFGVTFTSGIISQLVTPEDWLDEKHTVLLESFGTVDRSILTLFMAMSGGNDWTVYYETLKPFPVTYRIIFLCFISFTLFAIVNIVTGVFVEAALQSNLKDRDIIAHEELQSKKMYLESMQDLFQEMDDDGQGTISMEEFESKLKDERVVAFFNALKLDVSDARVLFRLLDVDDSGDITIQEFLDGCYELQGESRSLDMKIMQIEVKQLRETSADLQQMLRQIRQHIVPEAEASLMPTAKANRLSLNFSPPRAWLPNDSTDQPWGSSTKS